MRIEAEPATISNAKRYMLPAQHINQTFQIDVAMPYAPPGQQLPVIFVLDGNMAFPLAVSTARLLQMGPFPLPPAIIVAIGYPSATPEEEVLAQHLRVRDMTPWIDEGVEARYRNAPEPWRMPPHISQGGAAQFAAFIEEELKPFIAARYPVDLSDATLVGMSLGGLFVLYSLFTDPARYRRYVAASPGLYWDNRRIFELEAASIDRLSKAQIEVFLSAGGHEEAMDAPSRFVSNVYELDARVRSRRHSNLNLRFHVFPDETHMSVFPAALSRGLVEVFGGHRETSDWGRALASA